MATDSSQVVYDLQKDVDHLLNNPIKTSQNKNINMGNQSGLDIAIGCLQNE